MRRLLRTRSSTYSCARYGKGTHDTRSRKTVKTPSVHRENVGDESPLLQRRAVGVSHLLMPHPHLRHAVVVRLEMKRPNHGQYTLSTSKGRRGVVRTFGGWQAGEKWATRKHNEQLEKSVYSLVTTNKQD